MVATVRKARAARFSVNSAAVADILDVLARHNPGISRSVLKGKSKVVAAVTAAAVRLSDEQQRQILAHAILSAVKARRSRYYPDGHIREKVKFVNDRMDGEYISYFENGHVREHEYYRNGRLDGRYEIFYKTGHLKLMENFRNGKFDGEYICFTKTGRSRKKGSSKTTNGTVNISPITETGRSGKKPPIKTEIVWESFFPSMKTSAALWGVARSSL